MRVLVVNTGSSSLKLSVLDGDRTVGATIVERWSGEDDLEPLRDFLDEVGSLDAVGHRIVHGGPELTESTIVDEHVLEYLDSVEDLAPLHNPRGVAAIRAVREVLGAMPEVACFDTSFHADIPAAAHTFALPREWNRQWQLRRYGFHGLSHGYAVRRAGELVGRPLEDLRIVSCHLGSGASLAAVVGGRSVDTTMGFTPSDGLVMATRPGSVDPGLVLWLLSRRGLTLDEVEDAFEHGSGLKGLSGTAGDLRDVLKVRACGGAEAGLAYDVFIHRLRREVGAMTASAGGVDVLVMTGGIGENSPQVRADGAAGLGHLGVRIDEALNATTSSDADISDPSSTVRTVVVGAREDLEIARETRQALAVRSA